MKNSRTASRPIGRLARRGAMALLGVVLCGAAQAFGFDDVAARASKLAAAPYQAPVDQLPRDLREMGYDAYRDIRFKPERALWRGDKLPFELMFFHAGRPYHHAVRINQVTPNGVEPLAFDPAQFDYGRNKIDPKAIADAGYAGFRVHYPINKPSYKDEVLLFLGASYFRAVAKDQVYGLSARGLAINTATPQGEEFPRFTEFWIERPKPKATSLTIHALLDSPSVSGAYRFVLTPGADTVMDVKARLFPRQAVKKLGTAPLTSMYFFGENQPGRNDYRPEVHDSDGLSVHTGEGEWIWRPLVNPQRLLVTSFATTNPRGFGLIQRDRAYTSYEDPEALYHRRPSLWIEPKGDWGAGRIELVQIPSPDETNDNIVAYWLSDAAAQPNQPVDLMYRMHWQMQQDVPETLAFVEQSRRGRGYVKQPDGDIKFVVDFDGGVLRTLAPETKLEAALTVGSNAELTERNLFRDQVTGAWRMTVRFKRTDPNKPVELRGFLQHEGKPISETWSYIVPPEPEKS